MGIGEFLRRRRERESALSPGSIEELGAEAGSSASEPRPADQGAATDPPEAGSHREPSGATELPGADAAELGSMLRRAAASGLPQVSTESHALDPEGGDVGKEILGILGAHGLGGAGGAREVDPEELRDLHEQVRDALRRQGIDPDSDLGT